MYLNQIFQRMCKLQQFPAAWTSLYVKLFLLAKIGSVARFRKLGLYGQYYKQMTKKLDVIDKSQCLIEGIGLDTSLH